MRPWLLTTPADYDLGHVRAVLPGRIIDDARVVVRDGVIVEVGPRPRGCSVDVDGGGRHVLPGLIDVHNDTLSKECQPRPGASLPPPFAIASTGARLRAAGITTVYHGLAYQEHSAVGMRIDSPRAAELAPVIDAAAADPLVDHRVLHRLDQRCAVGRADLERRLSETAAGAAFVVSHEDHTPGQGQYLDPRTMQRWLELSDGMTAEQAAEHVARWRATRERDEAVSVREGTLAWLGELARAGRIRLWGHDVESVEDVDALLDRGGQVAEFPTTRVAAERARAVGLSIVAGAPNVVRGGSHAGNVSAAELAAAGLVDALASDYLPTALLCAAVQLARAGTLSLSQAVGLVTAGPADAVGLDDRGQLTAGRRADLVVADLSRPYPVVHWVARAPGGTG
ncbi:alpha-D-ribose 1-methylphosphonate 5-triphosphate diphosphatase [Jiangella asiatica]|uniref:Alpha-D-ribose 1-methylphosphonate 5-triphosphate diphosphatase n=1 Tax=Jiangella asiatica TaxID=2530372 RepID=A0A4R5DNU4_9ACTN|nr:alpha-D-ribose 1-methylphosphonate 5-triphosphate diphosphatase [Jiangella asiatica]TDE16006.1 alpha-D-ribose 1-methylphosphonate 5-triphosphate diphosphatase [Jiangella asiatica]